MLIKASSFGFTLFLFLQLILSCEHGQGIAPQGGVQPTLSSIQSNIFTPKCVNQGCHPGNNAPMSLQSGLARGELVNQPSAYENGSLLRVKPNDSNNSALYLKVIGDGRTGGIAARMPLDRDELSNEEIEAIRQWIDDGAPAN